MSEASILVVDDDPSACDLLRAALQQNGHTVKTTTSAKEALSALEAEEYDLIVTDLDLGDDNGLDLCRRSTENRPDVPVIVVTGYGSMEAAIGAIRAGAYDFVTKPIRAETLSIGVNRALQHRRLTTEVRRLREEKPLSDNRAGIMGESRAIKKVLDLITRVGGTDTSVLIMGESGTGKELVARALHNCSPRKDERFIAINCAAVPENLLESELFGHSKGAFTDAKETRKGLFVEADNGTLFLDEIGEMPLAMQSKLLRALQEQRVRPVGSTNEVTFDTRIIAATNLDLEAQVAGKKFREDLFYRINVVQIALPPLRARGNDVLLLAHHFIAKMAVKMNKDVRGMTSEAAARLVDYDWPGNVRELENCIERAVALTRYDRITQEDLPERVQAHNSSRLVFESHEPDLLLSLAELERRYIERVLKVTGGNKAQAARILGLGRRTLYRRMDKLGVEPTAAE